MISHEEFHAQIIDGEARKIESMVRDALSDAWTVPTSTASETLDMLAPVVARMLVVERYRPCTHES